MSKLNQINEQIGRYRWTICGLVFFATKTPTKAGYIYLHAVHGNAGDTAGCKLRSPWALSR